MAAMLDARPATDSARAGWRPVRWHRGLQLALATLWLVDGVLQLQPQMFVRGPSGFSGMLASTARGNPGWIASSIRWDAAVVGQHAALVGGVVAAVQILLGLAIAWRPTVRAALAASIVWSVLVWWFGEGLGGVLAGTGTPLGGGPGAVLFYALIAVLLWPPADADRAVPFAAAAAIGAMRAKAVWSGTWVVVAVLALIGAGRSAGEAGRVILASSEHQPGWLVTLDHHVASFVGRNGLAVAVVLATLAMGIAIGVHLGPRLNRVALVLAMVVGVVVWVLGEHFGTILGGGATDPNSGPLVVLLALCYWPTTRPGSLAIGGTQRVTTGAV